MIFNHRTPSPLASESARINLFGFEDFSFTPASNLPAAISDNTEDSRHSPAPSQQTTHDSYLEAVCASRGLPVATICGARCKLSADTKQLLPKVLNHQCMANVLVALGIQDHPYGHFAATKVVVIDGRDYTAVDVIKEFRWSTKSYKHKCQWFGWAAHAAHASQWCADVPVKG